MTLPLPESLGRYQVLEVLGRGAMGSVYKGFDPVISRTVALKTIRKDLLGSDQVVESVARFRNEAMASGRLNHPGIIAIHEYGEDDETVFIVMEYAPGDNLRSYISRHDSIKLTEISNIVTQLLEALDFAHENGVIHRDVKPANIIVSSGLRIKVADFGIAHINTSTLTQTGMIVGTPSYMAPEQYIGLGIDRRADIFSAGIVLYELLTGAKPFEGSTESVGYKICHEPHRSPSLVNVSLPIGLDVVINRALAKKPEDRFSSAREFSHALHSAIEQHEENAAEATVIRTYASSLRATPTRPNLSSSGSTGWQPAALASLEAMLAPYVGPLARTLVKRNAAQVFTLEELKKRLSMMIEDPSDRAAFLEASKTLFEKLGQNLSAVPMASARAPVGPHNALTQKDYDLAVADLTEFLGPIAKVLVKKAAMQALDVRDLYTRLAEHLSSADEKSSFLKVRGF